MKKKGNWKKIKKVYYESYINLVIKKLDENNIICVKKKYFNISENKDLSIY